MGFFKPSVPKPQPVEQAPDTASVESDAARERKRRQAALGRQSTLLSDLSKATTDAASATSRSTLLG